MQPFTHVDLAAEEESGEQDGVNNERIIEQLNREEAHSIDEDFTYPTLADDERHALSARLQPLLPKSILSISFSRGFGMTASQLGVFLVHKDHPYRHRFEQQWNWLTYFYNAVAVRTLMAIDLPTLQSVDAARREWVAAWLKIHDLPNIETGSYYEKSFIVKGTVPSQLQPLARNGLIRLCFKPPLT